jgi:hypothetical protein
MTVKIPSIPKEILRKIEELAKAVAKEDMAASISISEDESEEEEDVYIDDDHEDDDFDDVDEAEHDNKLLSGISNLLDDWDIRDPDEDAGRYYQELKELYEKHKDD